MLLRISNIKKRYSNDLVLKGVSLELRKGEIVALLGVNGAGKTTLASVVAALHPPTEGDIVYEGKSIYQNISAYRHMVGYCPQKPNLLATLTMEENLVFAGRFFGMAERVIERRVGELSEIFLLKPYMGYLADALSGGWKQRFLLARSMMHHPKLLILDEPTVGLDPHIRRELWQLIRELKGQGLSVLLTTHYLEEADQLADRVCILDRGLIKIMDTPERLKEDFKKAHLEDVFLQLMTEEVVA